MMTTMTRLSSSTIKNIKKLRAMRTQAKLEGSKELPEIERFLKLLIEDCKARRDRWDFNHTKKIELGGLQLSMPVSCHWHCGTVGGKITWNDVLGCFEYHCEECNTVTLFTLSK